jgi:hypothetical protein
MANPTTGPWRVGETAAGQPAVYGVGNHRTTPFGTSCDYPICKTDTVEDAQLIVSAVNAMRNEDT